MKSQLNRLLLSLAVLFLFQACEPGTQINSINVKSSQVGGVFSIDGQVYRNGGTSSAFYQLTSHDSATDTVNLGYYYDRHYALNVVKGEYALNYYYQFGDLAPVNYREKLNDLSIQKNQFSKIDVARIEITPEFTLNGAAFPQGEQQAAFYLQSLNSDELLFLGYSNFANSPVAIIPGEYSVIYEFQSSDDEQTQLPRNTHAVLHKNLKLEENQILEINVESVNVNWVVYLNGREFPNSAYDYANLSLTDSQQTDSVFLGATFASPGVTPVIPGTYQLLYHHREGSDLPQNQNLVLPESYALMDSESRLFADIPSITVTGSFTLNGQAAPNDAYDSARINLRASGTDFDIQLGNTFESTTEPLVIIPAEYNVIYERREYQNLMPANKEATLLSAVNLSESQHLDLDIPTVRVDMQLTLDGEDFPNSAYDSARIYIHSDSDEEPTQLHSTELTSEPVVLIQDQYDLYYQIVERGDLPVNDHYSFIEDLNLSSDTTIAHDFKSTRVQVIPLLNGKAFPRSAYHYGNLYAASEDGEKILLGASNELMQPIRLMQGDYRVYFEFKEGADVMPVNSYAFVDEITVSANTSE